ncbi:MAG: MFS transporter [Candidatus Marinimicrobia bacterium]|jgi:UMF1 family MFS transporter|nr:MFS transporter [Candidatus Neomarinimicrobiota bacterium]MDP6593366.1 MFS transporter [Candidatus Neomarinimicrobiota bacterium]MDP6836969.1 MFS transporter [Candidatus Neomarinimicrobiota bacterium]|tara:strand:- start:8084 stop:9418 length:1335 start_codon:yes stop_codon:yes gene_type:complete
MTEEKRAVWGWALYDWANSAFATTVMAGFFPIFFKQYWSYGADVNVSTAQLGFGNSLASLFVALIAPILGAAADKGSAKKKFLIFFAYLGVLMTAALFLVEKGAWAWAIFIYAMGTVGFAGANVFYDSLLPTVAGKDRIDSVSGLGFGMGYLGGGLLFALNVAMVQFPHIFGIADAGLAVKYSFLSVAIWWGLFTLFTIFWVKEEKQQLHTDEVHLFVDGFRQLAATFREIRYLKTLFLFLIAYWLYIDGVDTIIKMAVDYGLSLGFDDSDLILALLIVQFIGFPAAILYSKLGEKWGVRKAIFLAIGVYSAVTLWGMMMTNRNEFYLLAVVIGLVQGGIQALSRSYYSRLIPVGREGEFYGFYNMLGKFAAIVGPALMGIVGLAVKRILMPPSPTEMQLVEIGRLASRWSIGSILILFVAGAILLYLVDEEKGERETALLEAQ